jgi:pyruvate dehydrogenase E2 component (dihydrolipoamide acetyltransferase)
MATVFRLPDIGEGLTEAEIVEWFHDVGDHVEADQPMVSVETDKTQVELPAPITGVLLHRGGADGDVLAVGSILAVIGVEGEQWSEARAEGHEASTDREVPPHPVHEAATGASRPQALPLVRRQAREHGVDLAEVMGTGPGGRITRADLARHLDAAAMPVDRPPLVGTLDEAAEDLSTPRRPGRVVRLSPTRKAIAAHLTRSWVEIPHVTTFDAFDATALLESRRAASERLGRRVPLEAVLMPSVAHVLGLHPEFNATLTGDELILHERIDMGIAIDGGDGLLVGVVHGADHASLVELVSRIEDLVTSARDRSLTRADVTGATFTLSNIGAVGGGYGTPIIPIGTTAILSVGRAEPTPVVREGSIVAAPMAPLSLSYDHRVIDGALGRAFMADLVASLTDPRER